jgi:alpha-tubulin suppressor-like RCC1 family protein
MTKVSLIFTALRTIILIPGEVYAIGKNIDNYLGIGTWTGRDDEEHWRYHTLQKVVFPDDVKIAGVTASLGCTIAWTEDGEFNLVIILHYFNDKSTLGEAYGFGFDGSGQLGLGIKSEDEDKVVPLPRKITSLHLDDYKISMVSLADQHAVFLTKHA